MPQKPVFRDARSEPRFRFRPSWFRSRAEELFRREKDLDHYDATKRPKIGTLGSFFSVELIQHHLGRFYNVLLARLSSELLILEYQ